MDGPAPVHTPVLLAEVVAALRPKPGGRYLDATVGLGGHAEALLLKSAPDGVLSGVDCDPEALALTRARLAAFGGRLTLIGGRYEDLPALVGDAAPFDGVLFDLGASSLQFDSPERGFAFGREGPLDMRMNRRTGETATDLVARLSERDLADLIYRWGEERWSRRIARAIVTAQAHEPITTTGQLAAVVARAIPRRFWPRHIHPATRTFQALRIAVNEELVGLGLALEAGVSLLAPGGRAAAISFHSLEDRIVKQTWRRLAEAGVQIVTKRPITPGPDEAAANPRARSAKLRVIELPRVA
ncbi:MAG TPA: 16S rRNA (cytosine(1402)-N(4))-methyltransferase RsmH [Candidatus Baltobacteraceae bacterium]|nr:16S rRNA (cytosine(1402)-N(4))-methyltransferase RsmH [Candidatus Baltobacteraceae bacterium]